LLARLAAGNDRRHLKSGEPALRLFPFSDFATNEVAGEQGAQPRYPAKSDARLDDPELRVCDHEAGRAFVDLCRHLYLRVIGGKLHRRHLADVHVLVFDKGLAGLDPLGGLEHDGDGWAFAHDSLDCDPDGHHGGENGYDPDDGDPLAPPRHDGSLRNVIAIGALSHGVLVRSFSHPKTSVGRRILQRSLLARLPPRKTALPDRAPPTSTARVAR